MGTDDLNPQQTAVGVEVQDDVAPAGTLDDDVLHGRSVRDFVPNGQVGSVCITVVRHPHEGIRSRCTVLPAASGQLMSRRPRDPGRRPSQ